MIVPIIRVVVAVLPVAGRARGVTVAGSTSAVGVVGAASAFGPQALALATTVKLTRALWIMPCVLGAALLSRSDQKAKFPLFVLGFVAAAGVRTLLPSLLPLWDALYAVARQSLVLTLFLIGTGLTRDVLRRVGVRPFAQGAALWLLVSAATLAAIVSGLIPAL